MQLTAASVNGVVATMLYAYAQLTGVASKAGNTAWFTCLVFLTSKGKRVSVLLTRMQLS